MTTLPDHQADCCEDDRQLTKLIADCSADDLRGLLHLLYRRVYFLRLSEIDAALRYVRQCDKRNHPRFRRGDLVQKVSGAHWLGRVVGEYSTDLTPEGYCIESVFHPGSVQIYPAKALQLASPSAGCVRDVLE